MVLYDTVLVVSSGIARNTEGGSALWCWRVTSNGQNTGKWMLNVEIAFCGRKSVLLLSKEVSEFRPETPK